MRKISTISSSKAEGKKPATAAVIHFPAIHRNTPGSLAWIRERGLQFPSDLAREYEGTRKPRGPYSVPLPEDYQK
ncbi:MAG: hypothetical protein AB2563_19680 [Candidatus Thiodiazotropha endolucinida]